MDESEVDTVDDLGLRRNLRLAAVLLAGASLAACVNMSPRYPSQANGPQSAPPTQGEYKVGKPYQVGGIWYVPREQPNYDQTGVASWYGEQFHMKATANGERFDMATVSAAHTTLPLPSMVEVTNLDNGRKLVVRVNDRGPFVSDRIIDLSREIFHRTQTHPSHPPVVMTVWNDHAEKKHAGNTVFSSTGPTCIAFDT